MSFNPMSGGGGLRAPLLATAILLATASAGLAQTTAAPDTTPATRQPSSAQAAQQDRMRDCNTEAGKRNLAGDARRPFMSECLAGRMPPAAAGTPSPAQAAQRERMIQCNAEAGTRALAVEARRDFMRDCLAGKTPAAPATGGRRG